MCSEKMQKGNVSNYEAVSAVIAGNLGTGNISGMAVALATGGPGSLVWMWVMTVFGSIIQYGSCLLGARYREKNEAGEYVGGPMYYLRNGLGFKKTAALFSLFTLFAALTVGNFAQVNSIVLPLKSVGLNPFLCGMGIAVLAGAVLLGGVQRIAGVAASVVPFMAFLYLAAGIIILCFYGKLILPSLLLILKSACSFGSFAGGAAGFTAFKALSTGFERGLFATDAGTGIVPILQSGARSKNPVINGVVTLVAPFLVMCICTITGLILLVTGAWTTPGLESTNMVVYAFNEVFGSSLGISIVILTLSLFAFTTIIAWGGCAEKAAEFLWGMKKAKFFRYVYLCAIPFGAVAGVNFVWVLADLAISCMLITNLIGIIGLGNEVVLDTKRYFDSKLAPQEEL